MSDIHDSRVTASYAFGICFIVCHVLSSYQFGLGREMLMLTSRYITHEKAHITGMQLENDIGALIIPIVDLTLEGLKN